jgi:hypothetical protein
MVAFLASMVGVMSCSMIRDLVLRHELLLAVADVWVLVVEVLVVREEQTGRIRYLKTMIDVGDGNS